jgi:hypothetical protein
MDTTLRSILCDQPEDNTSPQRVRVNPYCGHQMIMSTLSSPKTAASPIDIQVRLTTILGPLPLLDHHLVD